MNEPSPGIIEANKSNRLATRISARGGGTDSKALRGSSRCTILHTQIRAARSFGVRETPWGMVWAFGDGKMYTVSSAAVGDLPPLVLPVIGLSHQNTLRANLGSISQVMEQMYTRTAF